jgi:hypothetical protein
LGINTQKGKSIMTLQTIAYVLRLHKSGNDANLIAEHTGLSFWTVAEILNKYSGFKNTI